MARLNSIETEQKALLLRSVGTVVCRGGSWFLHEAPRRADFYPEESIRTAGYDGVFMKDFAQEIAASNLKPSRYVGGGGILVPHSGEYPVFCAKDGQLMCLGDRAIPVTNASPLHFSTAALLGLCLCFRNSWASQLIESMRAIDVLQNVNGAKTILKKNLVDWALGLAGSSKLSSVLLGAFKDMSVVASFSNSVRAAIKEGRTEYSTNCVTFGLAHGGQSIGIRVWSSDENEARQVLGYVPTSTFPAFVVSGSPLLSEKDLYSYLRSPTIESRPHSR